MSPGEVPQCGQVRAQTDAGSCAVPGTSVPSHTLCVCLCQIHPQVCFQLWLSSSLMADSLAVACQTLIARSLAVRDTTSARQVCVYGRAAVVLED